MMLHLHLATSSLSAGGLQATLVVTKTRVQKTVSRAQGRRWTQRGDESHMEAGLEGSGCRSESTGSQPVMGSSLK